MCVKKTVWHRRQPHPLLLEATPTKHATKPHPSNTSNVGVPCGCGLIFNDIHRFFSFSLLPTYPILSSGLPEKQVIELVWLNQKSGWHAPTPPFLRLCRDIRNTIYMHYIACTCGNSTACCEAPPLFSKPVAPLQQKNTPLSILKTLNTLINMKEVTNKLKRGVTQGVIATHGSRSSTSVVVVGIE